tara:strand:+ start:1403 stop:3544 length:2142 start_codon:yes stop_codon:yes gene_type:complete
MATDNNKLKQLESALIQADAAGDTEAATILAAEIRKIKTSELSSKELDKIIGISPKDKLADFGKSLSGGVLKGLSYLPGIPGDLERLSTYIPGGKNTIGFDYGQPGNDESFGKSATGKYIFPSSKQIQNYLIKGEENLLEGSNINPILGEAFNYQPTTNLGRYTDTMAQFASPSVAGKTNAARKFGTVLGAGGGATFQGLQDAGASPGAALGITLPVMIGAGLLGGPSTAARMSEPFAGLSDDAIREAKKLEELANSLGIKLTPGELVNNKLINELSESVVKNETSGAYVYNATKNRPTAVKNVIEQQADKISPELISKRTGLDVVEETAKKAIKDVKIKRTSESQKAGYGVSNTEFLDPTQVMTVINRIDEAIANTNNKTNINTLKKIKNELIVSNKNGKIIPVTSINKLDNTFKIYRDKYKDMQAGKESSINKVLGIELFTQADDGILNMLNNQLRTNKSYANANDEFAKLTNELVIPIQRNVDVLAKNGLNFNKIKSFIFDPTNANAFDIKKTLDILNKVDPQATIDIANVYFRNMSNRSINVMRAQGDDLTEGFKFTKSIMGTAEQRANFMAVLDGVAKAKGVDPKQLKIGFENMFKVLERTGRLSNINKPGFNADKIANQTIIKDAAMMKTFNPFVRLATKYGEIKAGGAYDTLGRIFARDDSIEQLVALAKTDPNSKVAIRRVLYIVDSNQALEDRQNYLNELSANQ